MKRISITTTFLMFLSIHVTAPLCSAQHRPQLSFEGDQAEIAMPLTNGRPLVQVHIGETGPYAFILDTGSTISAIDRNVAAALELEVIGEIPVGAPGGSQVPANRVRVSQLKIGAIRIGQTEMVALDLDEMTGGLMQGILGMDLFREVVLTYDPVRGRAIVSRSHLTAEDPGVVRMSANGEGVNVPISVAGSEILAHFDSGSPGGVTLPVSMMDELPLGDTPARTGEARLVGSTRTLTMMQLQGTVTIGLLEYENPSITFIDPSAPYANIGSQILNELVLTIDQSSRLISFARAGETKETSGASRKPRRLGVRFRGMGGAGLSEIVSVDSGSLGERVGFRAGDKVVSLNGQSMSDYDQNTLGQLIRGSSHLTWVVERAGNLITIVVP